MSELLDDMRTLEHFSDNPIIKERDQLRARVARLESELTKFRPFPHGSFEYNEGCEDMGDSVEDLLNETRAQSLSAIKADALEEVSSKAVHVEWLNGSRNQVDRVVFAEDLDREAAALREGDTDANT